MAVSIPSSRSLAKVRSPVDPGVQVTAASQGAAIGRGLTQTGSATFDIGERFIARDEANDSAASFQTVDREFRERLAATDFSQSTTREEFGAFLEERVEQAVTEMPGRPAAKERHRRDLMGLQSQYERQAGGMAVKHTAQRRETNDRRFMSSIITAVDQDPDDLPDALVMIDAYVAGQAAGMSPSQVPGYGRFLRGQAVEHSLRRRIAAGDREGVEEMFGNDLLMADLDSGVQSLLRIERTTKIAAEARQDVEFTRETTLIKIRAAAQVAAAKASRYTLSDARNEFIAAGLEPTPELLLAAVHKINPGAADGDFSFLGKGLTVSALSFVADKAPDIAQGVASPQTIRRWLTAHGAAYGERTNPETGQLIIPPEKPAFVLEAEERLAEQGINVLGLSTAMASQDRLLESHLTNPTPASAARLQMIAAGGGGGPLLEGQAGSVTEGPVLRPAVASSRGGGAAPEPTTQPAELFVGREELPAAQPTVVQPGGSLWAQAGNITGPGPAIARVGSKAPGVIGTGIAAATGGDVRGEEGARADLLALTFAQMSRINARSTTELQELLDRQGLSGQFWDNEEAYRARLKGVARSLRDQRNFSLQQAATLTDEVQRKDAETHALAINLLLPILGVPLDIPDNFAAAQEMIRVGDLTIGTPYTDPATGEPRTVNQKFIDNIMAGPPNGQ